MYRSDLLAFSRFETGIKRNYSVLAAWVVCQVWVCYCQDSFTDVVNGIV